MTDISPATVRLPNRTLERPIRALHGVNNGPVTYGGFVDVSEDYRAAGIPSVRIHDPNWPHAWEVDVHTIFPDFSKDPEDPASYDFHRTDDYLASIIATGATIVYRLGESIEHTTRTYFVHPPADFEKWARICAGIVRHYNLGWADGFHYGIEHWELWNETDLVGISAFVEERGGPTWTGTIEDYFRIYEVTATHLKQQFPTIKIGGPAATSLNLEGTEAFLAYCRDHGAPLDFFSWHTYTGDLEKLLANAAWMERKLDEYGFGAAENILDEWNYEFLAAGRFDDHELTREVFGRIRGGEGAAFAASVLCELQDTRVDMAHYYDGQPRSWWCGLFDDFGCRLPTFWVFERFGRLASLPRRRVVEIDGAPQRVSALAGADHDRVVLWLTNPHADPVDIVLDGDDLPTGSHVREVIDDSTRGNAGPVETEADPSAALRLAPRSVSILTWRTAGAEP
jgi:hypothetical protein